MVQTSRPQTSPSPLHVDEQLTRARVAQFNALMLPIGIAFFVSYVAFAWLYRSWALVGGAVAVLTYCIALVRARQLVAASQHRKAALVTSYSLLLMVALGAPFLRFLFAGLLVIPVAAVALVLPYANNRHLQRFMFCAFLVDAWVVAWDGLAPPLFEPPPLLFCRIVMSAAVLISVGLTFRLLWLDSLRLRRSLHRAEEAVRARDEFLSVASHELNTPLTPLSLRLQSLARLAENVSEPQVRERLPRDLDSMHRQVRRLAELIHDLLDVSRIGAGRLQLELVEADVAALLREVSARFTEEGERVGSPLSVRVEGPVLARYDPLRLEQVLTNLLSNALKYGAGKPISLRLEPEPDRVRLVVQDEGIGIPANHLHRIFEKFERAVPERHYGGLGLGLYISREIMNAMGGSIRAESEVGHGATFTLELPAIAS